MEDHLKQAIMGVLSEYEIDYFKIQIAERIIEELQAVSLLPMVPATKRYLYPGETFHAVSPIMRLAWGDGGPGSPGFMIVPADKHEDPKR